MLKIKNQNVSTKKKINILNYFDFFDTIPNVILVDYLPDIQIKTLNKNKTVYLQDDVSQCSYFVAQGGVVEYSHRKSKSNLIESVFYKKSIFGLELESHETRRYCAKTILPTVLVCVPNVILNDMRVKFEHVNDLLIRRLYLQVYSEKNFFRKLLDLDAKDRLSLFLHFLSQRIGQNIGVDEILLNHGLTQQQIGDFIGISRQSVTYILNRLRERNEIYLSRKKILIKDQKILLH